MKTFSLFAAILLVLSGCSKDSASTDVGSTTSVVDYLAIKAGHSWTYATGTTSGTTTTMDTSSAPYSLSVYQTNTLIGGQPNAFILQGSEKPGSASNMAFCAINNTLYTYLGTTPLPTLPNARMWISGGVVGTTVAVGKEEPFAFLNQSGGQEHFLILRAPQASIATASLKTLDTLMLKGVAVGNTSMVLKRIGGSVGDTLVVLITVNQGTQAVTSQFLSWMPIWQQVSSSEASMYSWDTTYSFRRRTDTTLWTDKVEYRAVCSNLGAEQLSLLGSIQSCEKYLTTIEMRETISHSGQSIYSGSSSKFALYLWIIKGTGIVKWQLAGNALVPVVAVTGGYDASGILHGIFSSPRLVYGVIEAGTTWVDYLDVNTNPLAEPASSGVMILRSKNF